MIVLLFNTLKDYAEANALIGQLLQLNANPQEGDLFLSYAVDEPRAIESGDFKGMYYLEKPNVEVPGIHSAGEADYSFNWFNDTP
jgi:hypothetical protein